MFRLFSCGYGVKPDKIQAVKVNPETKTAPISNAKKTTFDYIKFATRRGQFDSLYMPSKVLILDVDDTLLDQNESKKLNKMVLINEPRIVHILEHAVKNNILIFLCTARWYIKQKGAPDFLNVNKVAARLGRDYFCGCFYTNGESKLSVADYIFETFFNSDDVKRDKMLLVDDYADHVFEYRKAGYGGIQANKTASYLAFVEKFVGAPEYEDMHEVKFSGDDMETVVYRIRA